MPGPELITTATPRPAATPAPEGVPGRVVAVTDVGPTVRTFQVERPPGFTFRAGQHLKVGTPGTRRGTFSIASAPSDPYLEVCIKLVPDGRLTPSLFRAQVGDVLDVDWRAKGGLRFDDQARSHLMVATAAGIAPLRSLLRDARHRGSTAEVVVLHGASHVDELPYRDELLALMRKDPALRYLATISRPNARRNRGWSGLTGRVERHLRALSASFDQGATRVYAVGNAGMVSTVRADLGGFDRPVATETFK